jgi:hypothetical protein
MSGVAWTIVNRMAVPHWWNHNTAGDVAAVVMAPWQYTSMTGWGDPQLETYPQDSDPTWAQSQKAFNGAQSGTEPDPTSGANSYYDKSLDGNPPSWTKASSSEHKVDIGALRFWKVA